MGTLSRPSAALSTIRIGLLGYGRVGQAVAACAEVERDRLAAAGVDARCLVALVRDVGKPRGGPIVRLTPDPADVIRSGIDVVVEVLGGCEPARTHVAAALRRGIPVVSANKSLIARHGRELRGLARACSTTLTFDAAVVAGVPFVGALSRRPIVAGARRIEGIVNGTSHYVVSAIARGAAFETALGEAVARGYAEPESAADINGRDAAEKLTILAHLAGRSEIEAEAWPRLGVDVLSPGDLAGARALGGTIKPVAIATTDPAGTAGWVGPAFLPGSHPFARLDGIANALRLTGAGGHTVSFAGPGAGPDVTAATVLDDVVECLWQRPGLGSRQATVALRPSPFALAAVTPSTAPSTRTVAPPAVRWFVSVASGDELSVCDVVTILEGRRIPPGQTVKERDRVVALTAPVSWASVQEVLAAFRDAKIPALALPVLDE